MCEAAVVAASTGRFEELVDFVRDRLLRDPSEERRDLAQFAQELHAHVVGLGCPPRWLSRGPDREFDTLPHPMVYLRQIAVVWMTALAFPLHGLDLSAVDFALNPATLSVGGGFQKMRLRFSVANAGTLSPAANRFQFRIFLSAGPALNPEQATLVSSFDEPFAGHAHYSSQTERDSWIPLPAALLPGEYRAFILATILGPHDPETDVANNRAEQPGVIRIVAEGFPLIVTEPSDTNAIEGRSVELRIGASGLQPLSYRWLHDESPVAGSGAAVLTLAGVTLSDAGRYRVEVSNSLGIASSATVTLKVSPFSRGTVSIRVLDGDLGLGPEGTATVTLERTGSLDANLPVNLVSEFGDAPVTVVPPAPSFPPGLSEINLTVIANPSSDTISRSDKEILLRVAPGADYEIGSQSLAVLNLKAHTSDTPVQTPALNADGNLTIPGFTAAAYSIESASVVTGPWSPWPALVRPGATERRFRARNRFDEAGFFRATSILAPRPGVETGGFRVFGDARIDNLTTRLHPGHWLASVLAILDVRLPAGAWVIRSITDQGNVTFWFQSETNSWSQIVQNLNAAVHESAHIAGGYRGAFYHYATPRGDELRVPRISLFPRSEIIPLLPSHLQNDDFANIYLRDESGDQDIKSLLDELNAYTFSLLLDTAFADQASHRIDRRRGLLTFLLYLEVYLKVARTKHVDDYRVLRSDPAVMATIQRLWNDGWLAIGAGMGLRVLDSETDSALRDAALQAENWNSVVDYMR
jgi:hypothetical protein